VGGQNVSWPTDSLQSYAYGAATGKNNKRQDDEIKSQITD
jgi:hypothetical protein